MVWCPRVAAMKIPRRRRTRNWRRVVAGPGFRGRVWGRVWGRVCRERTMEFPVSRLVGMLEVASLKVFQDDPEFGS